MDLIEATKKYGALGVVIAWLAITNMRVATLEGKLDDCYGERINEMRHTSKKKPIEITRYYAIIPSNPVGEIRKA